MKIRIELRRKDGCDDVPLPRYMSEHAAGMDVCAACEGPVTVAPGQTKLVGCGFFMAVPIGYEERLGADPRRDAA